MKKHLIKDFILFQVLPIKGSYIWLQLQMYPFLLYARYLAYMYNITYFIYYSNTISYNLLPLC